MMFDKADKLQDFKDMLDDNIQKYSTTDPTKITEIASDLKQQGTNTDTNSNYFQNKSDEDIVKDTLNHNKDLRKSVDDYNKTINTLKPLVGDKVSEDGFNELVYMYSQINNLENRYKSTHTDLTEKLNNLKSDELSKKTFTVNLDNSEKKLTFDELLNLSPSDLRQAVYGFKDNVGTNDLHNILSATSILEQLRKEQLQSNVQEANDKIGNLGKIDKRVKAYKEAQKNLSQAKSTLEQFTPNATQIISSLNDLARIEDARSSLLNSFNKFASNPLYLEKKLNEDTAEAANKQEEIINTSLKDELKNAQSVSEVRDIVNREKDNNNPIVHNIVKSLSNIDNPEHSPILNEYRKIENLGNELNYSNALKTVSPDIQEGVKQLFNNIKSKSNSNTELLNHQITEDELGELGDRNTNYTQQDRENIANTYSKALSEISKRESTHKEGSLNHISNTPETKTGDTRVIDEQPPVGTQSTKDISSNNKRTQESIDKKNDIIDSKV